ncbi:MAG TPA: DUF4386 domain-containing protein [Acidobacteriaceae bacterium]|nr:DUF4386 domain-containing protein [Acidobacteriaceae bacterium]
MSTGLTIEQYRAAPPHVMARIAGVFYFAAIFTAVFAEFISPGSLPVIAAVAIPVGCYVAVTLLLYAIFRPANGAVALLAVSFGLVGLAFESLRLQPRGVNLAMTFHALYCLAIGWLMVRSGLLPRILGVLMVLAGMVWLIYLLPPVASYLGSYATMAGILCEVAPMLWLLIMGVKTDGRKE